MWIHGPTQEGIEVEEDSSAWGFTDPGPAPPRHKGSKLLLTTTLPGSALDLYEVLLANESHFLEEM